MLSRSVVVLAFMLMSGMSDAQGTSARAEHYLREAQLASQRGDSKMACEMADLAAEFGKGTPRQDEAAALHRQLCGRLSQQETQQRREADRNAAQWEQNMRARQQEEDRRAATFCKGRPSFQREVLEHLANSLRANPSALTLHRVEFQEGIARCRAVIYHPQGSIQCNLEFDARGIVQAVRGCS